MTNNPMSRIVQNVIPAENKLWMCPEAAAVVVGLSNECIRKWVRRGCSSYGYPIRTIAIHQRRMVDEVDVRVLAATQRQYALGKGPLPSGRREELRSFAFRLRAKMELNR